MPHAHPHPHPAGGDAPPPHATAERHELRTWLVAGLSAAAVAGQLIGADLTGSAALRAEALHMGAHVSAFVLAALAYEVARRLERAGRLRAAARTPDLAALANGLFLLVLGLELARDSWAALSAGAPVAYAVALGAAVSGLLINLLSAALLHHDHSHEPGHGRDMNFSAVRIHVLGDAAVAVLAIAGLLAGRLLGWRWTDGAAGLAGAALVVVLGAQVAWRSIRYLRADAYAPLPERSPPG